MAGGFTFDDIFLLGRDWGINQGQLSFVREGLEWRKQGRDVIDVKVRYAHILNITWMKLPHSNQLVLLIKDGCKIKFNGFSDQNVASLNRFFENECKIARINNADVQMGGEQPVVAYKSTVTLRSCGSFTLELYLSFLRFYCSVDIFKIQYSKIARVFVLPKSKIHTFVVITFHPFTKNGKTVQSHIVIKFYSGDIVESTLVMDRDLYATKYKDKLEPGYKGPIHEVFAKILCGLSGTNLIIPGEFRSVQNEYAVKSSLKSGNGVLYLLEKSFLFIPTPATLIDHDEIECVEFEMRSAMPIRPNTQFDLIVSLKTKQEYLFFNIEKSEYQKLLHYIRSKPITIKKLEDATQAPFGVAAVLQAEEDDAVDPHLERIMNAAGNEESDAEVEDFVTDKDDDGSSTDDSDGSDSGSEKERVPKKESMKEPTASKVSSSKKRHNDDWPSKSKKHKKTQEPKAPKKAPNCFMFFSQREREVEDFVTDKDDDGSSTDDSDGSDSGSEKERVPKKESMKKPTASKVSSSKKRDNDDWPSKSKKHKKTQEPKAPKKASNCFMFFSQREREEEIWWKVCLDSPLNKSGKLRALYVRTEKGVLFEIKPHVRIPRTFKRFAGIMLQLLQKLSISAVGKREKLMRVIKNPVAQYLPVNSRKIVFRYPLSAAYCITRITNALERKHKIL